MNKKLLEDINVRKERFTSYMHDIIQEHRNNLNSEDPKDLIDAYLVQMSNGKTFFSEPQLLAVLGDLFTANVETISSTIHWLLLAIVKYPDVQEKIYEQLCNVTNNERMPTLDDRSSLPYLEAAILEGYRFSSILPYGIPHSATEDTNIAGYHIPKNATVVGLFWKFNRDPRLWDSPECFDPQNHFDNDGILVKNRSLMPYSVGGRACLTEIVADDTIFLILASMLHRFQLLPAEDRIDLPCLSESQDGVVRTPMPFKIKFVPRHQNRRRHVSHRDF